MTVDLIRNLRAARISLSSILLDPNNPRLLDSRHTDRRIPDERIPEAGIQDDTFNKMMADEHEVKLLKDSISEVGFLPVDKIVVRPVSGETYVVVEGNRRITALRALQREVAAGEREVDPTLRSSFETLDVMVLGSPAETVEQDQWVLQGLRHLSGIKGWGLFQQAKAVEVLIDKLGFEPREAGESVGLTTNRVNRLYRALGAYQQMMADADYGNLVRPDMLSYFEEVMKRPSIKNEFLGFDEETRSFANAANKDRFFSWIVPSEDLSGARKIPRAIDVRFLEAIVQSTDAMRVMQDPDRNVYDAVRTVQPSSTFEWETTVREAITALDNIPAADLENLSPEQRALIEDLLAKGRTRLDQATELASREP